LFYYFFYFPSNYFEVERGRESKEKEEKKLTSPGDEAGQIGGAPPAAG
jgi:hypothetical protein